MITLFECFSQTSAEISWKKTEINKKNFKTKISANIYRFETFIFNMVYLS